MVYLYKVIFSIIFLKLVYIIEDDDLIDIRGSD